MRIEQEQVQGTMDAFYCLDREWRFTFLSREAEQFFQRSREELLGKNAWEEFPQAAGTAFEREYHRAMAHQIAVKFEEFDPFLKGWFEAHAYPSEAGLSVYFRNIPGRKQVENDGLGLLPHHGRKAAIVGKESRPLWEIPDALAQSFIGILLQLEVAEEILKETPEAARPHLAYAQGVARQSLAEARRFVQTFHLGNREIGIKLPPNQVIIGPSDQPTLPVRSTQRTLPAQGTGSVIAIHTTGLNQEEIENAILQVLARGRRASVDEADVSRALGMGGDVRSQAITIWANAFASKAGVDWERRQPFGDLLFSLLPATEDPLTEDQSGEQDQWDEQDQSGEGAEP